jgi:hypothetical protein
VLAASMIRVVMMDAASTPETLVNFYCTMQQNFPQDSYILNYVVANQLVSWYYFAPLSFWSPHVGFD